MRNPTVKQLFDLTGRYALVTGGAGHLGSAIVEALCEAGATVFVNGRNPESLRSVCSDLNSRGYSATPVPSDITRQEDRDRLAAVIAGRTGALHVLVNNAYFGNTGTMKTTSPDDVLSACNVTVASALGLLQSCEGLLKTAATQKGNASIVNIGSMYGVVSPDLRIYRDGGHHNPPSYGAAKAALLQLTRYAACEWADWNIRVNAISPGPFPGKSAEEHYPKMIEELGSRNPLGRIGRPHELKGAVVFLASDASSYVTGANLPVDGGWTTW